ncbi:hypothetical protein A4G20_03055 [Pasteurellaceae bacterium RH1A]|nr:hypothetical protein A4G20_03055 [Pasteurellaceae bacterium RH1A]
MQQNASLLRFLLAFAAIIIILAGVKLASEIVVPFLLALFIAIVCSPLVNFMTKRRVPLWLAIILLFILIGVVSVFLIGLINSTVREFSQSIPQYRGIFAQRLTDIQALLQKAHIPLEFSPNDVLNQLDPSVIMNFVSGSLLSFSGAVSNIFVLILVVIFMLLEIPTIKHRLEVVLKIPHTEDEQENPLERMLKGIITYLGVKSLMSIATGICVFIALKLLGVQYAVLWATVSFLLNYIPNIGSVIAAIPVVIQAFLLNGFPIGLGVMAAVIGVNTVIGNMIEPRLMGKTLGLSTLVVFLSLLFWGWLLGTVGMLLSVPLTMALKIALESSPKTARYAILLGDIDENSINQ